MPIKSSISSFSHMS